MIYWVSYPIILTMNHSITNTDKLQDILHTFANKLWEKLLDNNVLHSSQEELETIYFTTVTDLLGEKTSHKINKIKTKSKKETTKPKPKPKQKPKIPVPFYGIVEKNWCCGIKKNHGLYTQCPKARPTNCDYCSICMKQVNNNADGKPNCGDIRERAQQWSDKLDYKPPGMKKEIPYANVMRKLNVGVNEAQEVVLKLGWDPIPNCHFVEKKVRRGRPKTKIVVEDSDDEQPKKKRGRPKKKEKKELTDEELIAQFMATAL